MFRLHLVAGPQLSADGRHLAYVRRRLDRDTDGVAEEIIVTDLRAGTERRLSPGGHRAWRPQWSPDGRLAFLCDASGTSQLWLWAAGDQPAAQLTDGTDQVVDLDWSPDGRQVAITRARQANPGVAIAHGPWRLDGQPGLVTEHRRV